MKELRHDWKDLDSYDDEDWAHLEYVVTHYAPEHGDPNASNIIAWVVIGLVSVLFWVAVAGLIGGWI